MSLLRHPVVITSLEEDFRKFGLIKDDGREEEDLRLTESDDSSDFEEEVEETTEDEESEETTEDEESEETTEDDEGAMAEAVAFSESFNQTWASLGEDGVETVYLDESEMAELESMAEEVVELPEGIVDDPIPEDEAEISEDEDEETEEDEGEDEDDFPQGDVDADVDGDSSAFESVSRAMSAIEALLSEDAETPESLDEAIPAFANAALVAEKLYGFFAERAEAEDDEEYAEISEQYKQIAQYSAGIVDTLQTEDPETIDTEVLGETLTDYLGTILQGVETYAILREAEEGVESEDDDEQVEDDEQAEDDEGNE